MKPSTIKAAIIAAGTSQRAIADYLQVSPGAVNRVINGSMRSYRIEQELLKITGKPIYSTASRPGRKKTVWTGKVEAQI